MSELFSLALVKLPPSRIPALHAEMRKSKEIILDPNAGALVDVRVCYQQFLAAAQAVETVISSNQELDLILIDQDLDDVGYGIFDALRSYVRAMRVRQLPLVSEEEILRQDAQDLLSSLFPKGNEIFRYSHIAEWSEVKTLLLRSQLPENQKKIERLGLGVCFARMERCHFEMGRLLGVYEAGSAPQSGALAQFETALAQLISSIVLRYGQDTDEHRRWRELLIEPIRRHVELYREEQRRRAQTRSQSAEERPSDAQAD